MNKYTHIRNFVHDKFNVHTGFNLKEYETYLKQLKEIGVKEIEHACSNLLFDSQKKRLKNVSNIIHDLDMSLILYTGVFGTENLENKHFLKKYAQRDINQNILGLGKNYEKNTMMCPGSKYVEEISLPKIKETVSLTKFDGIFIDIPWILKKGCFCKNCYNPSRKTNNNFLVRASLEKIVKSIKSQNQNIKISVNASAPKIHNNYFSGAHINNLKNIFDEYITEWNPYRWNQNVEIISNCVKYAKSTVNTDILHATTLTTRRGTLYREEEYNNLFKTIIRSGAHLRSGISFPKEQLKIIGKAWNYALNEHIDKYCQITKIQS